jgi:hypothetical protein
VSDLKLTGHVGPSRQTGRRCLLNINTQLRQAFARWRAAGKKKQQQNAEQTREQNPSPHISALLLSSDRSSGFSEFNAGSFKGTPNRLESAGVWYVFPTFYVHHCAAINSRPLCQIALSPPQQRASYPDFRDSHKSEKNDMPSGYRLGNAESSYGVGDN